MASRATDPDHAGPCADRSDRHRLHGSSRRAHSLPRDYGEYLSDPMMRTAQEKRIMAGAHIRAAHRLGICPYWAAGRGCKSLHPDPYRRAGSYCFYQHPRYFKYNRTEYDLLSESCCHRFMRGDCDNTRCNRYHLLPTSEKAVQLLAPKDRTRTILAQTEQIDTTTRPNKWWDFPLDALIACNAIGVEQFPYNVSSDFRRWLADHPDFQGRPPPDHFTGRSHWPEEGLDRAAS